MDQPVLVYPILYVLELEDSKWYIGITNMLNIRLAQHWAGQGAVWTRLHKPKKVVEVVYPCTSGLEREKTLEYMRKYGYLNVRGGPWTSVNINEPRCLEEEKHERILPIRGLKVATGQIIPDD